MSRYRTTRTKSGAVIQAGLDPQPKPSVTTRAPMWPMRAVVINTYVTDETANVRKVYVECDVILVTDQIPLPRVPVCQPNHGVNNAHDVWVPRPTSRVISTNIPLTLTASDLRGLSTGIVPSLADLDGDNVLVEFVEGRIDHPIITRALSHEQSKRKIIVGSGWAEGEVTPSRGSPHKDEYYTHHKGTEVRINAKGDLLIDTVGAHDDPAFEIPSLDSGQVRVRLKDGLKFTIECNGTDVLEVFKDAFGVHVDLGEGATEPLIKGQKLVDWLLAHTHPSGTGPTSAPTNPTVGVPPIELNDAKSTQHRIKE